MNISEKYITNITQLEALLCPNIYESKINSIKKVLIFWFTSLGDKEGNTVSLKHTLTNVFDKPQIIFVNSFTTSFDLKENSIIINDADNNKMVINDNEASSTMILVKHSDIPDTVQYILNICKERGMLIINDGLAINLANNKYLTAEVFNKYNINQPKFCIVDKHDVSKEDVKLDEKLKKIYTNINDDSVYICKTLNGHGGSGVFICRGSNIVPILQCLFAISPKTQILIQEKLDFDDGDIRVHVITINGKQEIIASEMRLKGNSDFRTNLSLGNTAKEYKLSKEQEQLAKHAAKVSGLIWAGVDIIHTNNNKDYVIEINGAPGTVIPYNIDKEEAKEANIKFYTKLFTSIKTLCNI